MSKPAEMLEGKTLPDNWKVVEMIKPGPNATGGTFSIGYKVINLDTNDVAYLKALDFSAAFANPDPARTLEKLTRAYNFERDLLVKCKTKGMSRIVTPLLDGKVDVGAAFGPLNTVHYLLFEMAQGDIRAQKEAMKNFDLAWCLRSLHNVALGISQLHSSGITHQDLKPSNVLSFTGSGLKIADLGRASDIKVASEIDRFIIPGDQGYAAIEQFYSFDLPDKFESRKAADMYLFGSLIFFFFSDVSCTKAIMSKINDHIDVNFTNSDFDNDLAYIYKAFYDALDDLKENIKAFTDELTDDVIKMVKELCDPDPRRRGDKKFAPTKISQYSLERYISALDLLARKAEIKLQS